IGLQMFTTRLEGKRIVLLSPFHAEITKCEIDKSGCGNEPHTRIETCERNGVDELLDSSVDSDGAGSAEETCSTTSGAEFCLAVSIRMIPISRFCRHVQAVQSNESRSHIHNALQSICKYRNRVGEIISSKLHCKQQDRDPGNPFLQR